MKKRIATLCNNEEVDLDKLKDFSHWEEAEEGKITLFNTDGNPLTTISVSLIITYWLEQEERDYEEANK